MSASAGARSIPSVHATPSLPYPELRRHAYRVIARSMRVSGTIQIAATST